MATSKESFCRLMSFAYPQTNQQILPTITIICHCIYFGNGSDTLFDGCSGGAIWTDDFDVLAQFRFMMKDEALAYCPSFNPLMKLDYELSEIQVPNLFSVLQGKSSFSS